MGYHPKYVGLKKNCIIYLKIENPKTKQTLDIKVLAISILIILINHTQKYLILK